MNIYIYTPVLNDTVFVLLYMHWELECKSITRLMPLFIMRNNYLLHCSSYIFNIPSQLEELQLWWGCFALALGCFQKLDPADRERAMTIMLILNKVNLYSYTFLARWAWTFTNLFIFLPFHWCTFFLRIFQCLLQFRNLLLLFFQ